MNKVCYIKTYYGYGDNIWQYPFIKSASQKYEEVYLETFFPFLFEHIPNIKFIKPSTKTKLSTCNDSIEKSKHISFYEKPIYAKKIEFPYYLQEFKHNRNIVESFNSAMPTSDELLNEPLHIDKTSLDKAKEILKSLQREGKKVCLVRPPANRKDWLCSSRIPKAEYFQYIIDRYRDEFVFVSIGNKKNDVYEQELNGIDFHFDNGEIELPVLNALVTLVDFILTYNCFLFPLGVKGKTKTLVINGGYTDPKLYIDVFRMNLQHVRIVNPYPCCTCINRFHKCNREIPIELLDEAIVNLFHFKNKITGKRNLLISRIRAYRCEEILQNPFISRDFNIYTIDHSFLNDYKRIKAIKKAYQFPGVGNICRPRIDNAKKNELEAFCYDILQDNNINLVINAQPLHPYNETMKQVCNNLNIEVINYETFFDDKWILDKIGCQYTEENEIEQYIDTISVPKDAQIQFPSKSREKQPQIISRSELFQKYNLSENNKYIVVLGQLLWDMSLKQCITSKIDDPLSYYRLLFESNPDVTFLFKIHPKYSNWKNHPDMTFLKNFSNVIIVNESLETLFNNFNHFTSFSSSCILEGLIREKKFATIGYHFCNNPNLVVQLKHFKDFNNLYYKLNSFTINLKLLRKYLYFVCNLYTVNANSRQLYERLTLSSDQYFNRKITNG
jgi:hypothetical protein